MLKARPSRYQIRVQGALDPSWSDRLQGMRIETASGPEGAGSAEVTTLTGDLIDQSALYGVLTTLYELHLPILSTECLAAVDEAARAERSWAARGHDSRS